MKFYIDTANVDEIRRANDMGIIAGVTTNPSLIAKEGRDYAETLKEIATIVDGPISGEVKATTTDAEDMITEAAHLRAGPEAHGCQNPHDRRGVKGHQGAVRRGHPHELHTDFQRQPGAAGSPRRRHVCQPVFGASR